jgi:hypothetical protein
MELNTKGVLPKEGKVERVFLKILLFSLYAKVEVIVSLKKE